MKKKWWHNTIGYQIYPKSFQDSNGDGIGDIRGIINRLDYLKNLGINVIWVCPVNKSPMVDHGYDISDYDDIDPMFGSLADMEELIAEANKRGMKILMDLVVNHTSDQHEWFKKAMSDLNSKYADYYIIRDGVDGKEPNNWRSIFGGSAWEKIDGTENKYYLHLFTKAQPDLNWENPELREEIYAMINRWLDKGLGGFRVDAISHLKKDFTYKNIEPDGPDGFVNSFPYASNIDGIEVFLNELNERTFKPHDALTIGEVDDLTPEKLESFVGENGCFSTIFDFYHCFHNINSKEWHGDLPAMVADIRKKMFAKQECVAKTSGLLCNYNENHDTARSCNRFIPKEDINYFSKSMLAVMNNFLKGIIFIYQGQEIGMTDYPKKNINEYLDLATFNSYKGLLLEGLSEADALARINIECRENARTPMQWTSSYNAGFTEGKPWFDINPNCADINVAAQENDEKSLLSFYKKMIATRSRSDLVDAFIYGSVTPKYDDISGIIAYERALGDVKILVINNYSADMTTLDFEGDFTEMLLNNYPDLVLQNGKLMLLPYQSITVKL